MKNRRFQPAQCMIFTAFGVAALLPQPAHPGEAKPCGEKAEAVIEGSVQGPLIEGPAYFDGVSAGVCPLPQDAQAGDQEGAVEIGGTVESGPIVLLQTYSGRPEDLNIDPELIDKPDAIDPAELRERLEMVEPRFKGITPGPVEIVPQMPVEAEGGKRGIFLKRLNDGAQARIDDRGKDELSKEQICTRAKLPTAVNPGFSPKLYAQLRNTEGNVFFSPHSITEAMAMAHAGAGGNTATEIAKALGMSGDQETIAQALLAQRRLLMALSNKGDNRLNIANALCVTSEVPKQSYQTLLREQFDGELFSGELSEINAWVKEKTEGKIEKIIENLDPNTICVLLNAVYFKGSWESAFKAHNTHKAPFRLDGGKEVEVDMMRQEGHFRVMRDQGLIAVELPYQTSSSMVLIQPEKADGMEALEKQFSEGALENLGQRLAASHGEEIHLYVPKFKIETRYDLIEPMKQLGVVDAFDDQKADFKAMYEGGEVFISQIVHKATLEVDEKGSVASAVTEVAMDKNSVAINPTRIRFDRPFLVLIRESKTNSTLFMGRISDPTAK